MIPFSVLDLSLITADSGPAEAFANTRDLARHAEALGFTRYWLAEHHAMPGIASAATSVLIGNVASVTKHIRIGSGGIMLPNHSSLVIAEQFGTLETLYPGRIDLGLGRAPGADQATARALRRDALSPDRFPQDVVELLHYFEPLPEDQTGSRQVVAIPGAGLRVPVWLLGSSLFSAMLAARLGLPYAFAAHFAPEQMQDAIALYRANFEPSDRCAAPYVMLTVNVIAADEDEEARRLFTSLQRYFVALRRGRPTTFPAPVNSTADLWSGPEQAMIDSSLRYAFVGTPELVQQRLGAFIDQHRPDEVMVAAPIYDHAARLRSLALTAGVFIG